MTTAEMITTGENLNRFAASLRAHSANVALAFVGLVAFVATGCADAASAGAEREGHRCRRGGE